MGTFSRTHNYTVTALTATVIAEFDHHYLLTMQTGLGTTTPAVSLNGDLENSRFQNLINATAPSVASANERYQWVGWTGSGPGNFSGIDGGPAVRRRERARSPRSPAGAISTWST